MKTEFIPKVITLLAGAVVCITTIIKGINTTRALEMLLATLIIFYIVGIIAKLIIEKTIVSNSFLKQSSEIIEQDFENLENVEETEQTENDIN